MIVLKGLRLRNFKNLRRLNLEFKDLNIFIGPTNVGKTNILRAIFPLSSIEFSDGHGFGCKECEVIRSIFSGRGIRFGAGRIELGRDEWYNRTEKPEMTYSIDERFSFYLWLGENRENLGKLLSKIKAELGILDEDLPAWIKEVMTAYEKGVANFVMNEKVKEVCQKFGDAYLRFMVDELKKLYEEKKMKIDFDKIVNHLRENVRDNLFSIELTTLNEYQHSSHVSLFSQIFCGVQAKFEVLNVEDLRLSTYKGKSISEYLLTSRRFAITDQQKLIKFLQSTADPNISNLEQIPISETKQALNLITRGISASMNEQGSGVRSAICLAWDIIATKDGSILLIDEPEMGLHPSAELELLKLLIEESKGKQIFLATHDPTFVNPVIWDENKERISVFLYSPPKEEFMNVDLGHDANPVLFAGFLPHTESLKPVHLYVEGGSDVYIFQTWLQKHLKKAHEPLWLQTYNNIGIYHLGGSNWKHFLYTVPSNPYNCLVILDGDKKREAKKVGEKYKTMIKASRFKFCNNTKEIKKCLLNKGTPIYCLEKKEIEYYLDPILLSFSTLQPSILETLIETKISNLNELRDVCDQHFSNREKKDDIIIYYVKDKKMEIDFAQRKVRITRDRTNVIEVSCIEEIELKSLNLDEHLYDKILYGPIIAEMSKIPEEIKRVFEILTENLV